METTQKKPSVRQRIVDTACELFYRQGYRATGVNQVIAESGVAKASFYDHFPSKEDLLLEYVQETSRREIANLREEVSAFPTARERFFGPLRILYPWFEETGYRGCPFQNVVVELPPGDERIHEAVRRHREEERRLLRELAEAYIAERPDLAGMDCDALAETYLLLFEGAIATARGYQDTWPVKKAEATLEEYVEQGRKIR